MKTLHLGIIAGSGVGIIIVATLFFITLPQISAKKSTGDFTDFSANVPFQIHASRGERLTVPVDIYGSTTPRSVDIVISQADQRRGVVDPNNSTLPEGFSIVIPVKHIEMQAMDEKTHKKPLMTVNMTIRIDDTVKPGTYGFAINMNSKSPEGFPDSTGSAFYVNVNNSK